MGKFVTRRMDGNPGALPPNSAGWARTSSSDLPSPVPELALASAWVAFIRHVEDPTGLALWRGKHSPALPQSALPMRGKLTEY